MAKEPTTLDKLRRLPWSYAADAANMAFLQLTFFGSIFILFLSELGLSKGSMGFLLSLLPFAGAAAPLVASPVARFGYKRTYLTFFGMRTLIAALLLLTPWVMAAAGAAAALIYVSVIVAVFAIVRAVGITAMGPWSHEYVPNQIRGRYAAMDSALQNLVSFVVILGATYTLSAIDGLRGFMLLIAVGVLFGLAAVGAGLFIPGGSPEASQKNMSQVREELRMALNDRNYRTYLFGMGLVLLGVMPMISFLPLFMREQVGLNDGQVVLLQAAVVLGGLLTSYLWGWAADRYGSKPVMVCGLALRLLLPVGWLLMPRHSPWSLSIALLIALVQGIGTFGWITGSTRLRYVNLTPVERKTGYAALFVAWTGVVDGVSRLIGGWVLGRSEALALQAGPVSVDPYFPLFLMALALPVAALILMQVIHSNDSLEPSEFAKMFLRGRPLLALRALVGFYRAKDELTAIIMTARLGRAKSPLAADELVAALRDPRFHVRFEAIIAMAHSKPDTRLTEALVQVLRGSDPVLSVIAAWALGRLGDRRAAEPLRAGLNAGHAAVKGYSARSLGILGDRSVVPALLERLPREQDPSLQLAYASALGKLRAREAAPAILTLMQQTEDDGARRELALALARIVGEEHRFIQLLRQVEEDSCTAAAQALLAVRKGLANLLNETDGLSKALEECAETLASNRLVDGIYQMCKILQRLPQDELDETRRLVLRGCVQCLDRQGGTGEDREASEDKEPIPLEYVLLALHALHQEAPARNRAAPGRATTLAGDRAPEYRR